MSVEMPISCINRFLLLRNRGPHPGLDPMVDARGVSNNKRGPFIIFCFRKGFDRLIHIGSQSNLSYIDIAIAHRHHAEILFTDLFTCCRKFSNGSCRCGFRGLAACI